jgi:hypothetical protein
VKTTLACMLAATAVATGGCTWVSLSSQGEDVTLTSTVELVDCERVGNTRATVVRKVWFVPRPRTFVETELDTLARNEAAKLGGNTVAPLNEEAEGERDFAVYTCED